MEEVEVGMRPWKDRWWRGRVAGRGRGRGRGRRVRWIVRVKGKREGKRQGKREGKEGRMWSCMRMLGGAP